jgi:hypothetical protein
MPNRRKLIILLFSILLGLLVIFALYESYNYYWANHKYVPSKDIFTERVAYIDRATALGPKDFKTCKEDAWILDYYNPERARYIHGKNGLRKFILSKYENRNYTDSGYLNIRFVINCKGEAGRYVMIENDLDLNPSSFSENLKNQLFELTLQLKKWTPNFTRGENRDSYMYLSYRIVNGEITEILP